MAIARKPKKVSDKSNVNIDALINKGGSVAHLADEAAAAGEDTAEKQVALRIPSSMLSDLDVLLKRRVIRTPRHTWILEAIAEKLERENARPR